MLVTQKMNHVIIQSESLRQPALIKLVEELGGEVVKIVFLMELAGLKGRERLSGYDIDSAIIYEGK